MQRSPALVRKILRQGSNQIQTVNSSPCDVFINHRGIDTKRTVAGLLFYHFSRLRLHPFLDSKNMKPGDKLFDEIDEAIRKCKVGLAVFSPQYCESYFCLHELALLMESKKRVIPVFCNVKPSQLRVRDNGTCSPVELQRFSWALEEAKYTVGLTFDSSKGDWSEFLRDASDAVMQNLLEVEGEGAYKIDRKYDFQDQC
ncbi:disease resistance-like protein CSA1 [Prunus yedoensis var. nudiflora]|uniref:Disease resistance-like protein CSA1 n=1 Tax=Prunus yedoensis var. nudiflora TaxID=2094558 RepID=A0A314YF97_PRUYE|nr:disease resistance-like protein CSA1 [Prunus yedoensis var. nudiflora]